MTSTALADPMASVQAYLKAEKSEATLRAYTVDFKDFTTFCESRRYTALPAPPMAVALYMSQCADSGLKPSSLARRAAAIRFFHLKAGHDSPIANPGVKATMRGIRRKLGTAANRKKPTTVNLIGAIFDTCPKTVAGLRDWAILALGFAAALRRSELVALNVEDLEKHASGMLVHIRRSKTDQEAAGAIIPVPAGSNIRPVAAIDAWLEAAQIISGPIFREVDRHGRVGENALSDRSVARIIKRLVKAAGVDETAYSGHSMRAGFVTEALGREVDAFKIMDITRHVDPKTLRIYDRRAKGFIKHAGDGFL